MSEYWKSTPKYWCKFCSTYVRDTKFDRTQHDATPKHQNSIQRSLRTLHKENEREARDKDRAKAEVARLNGLVGGAAAGGPGASSAGNAGAKSGAVGGKPEKKQATADDRKRQLKQLVEMGITVPKEYRSEMAIAGDWETVSVRPIKQDADVKSEIKSEEPLSFGVRKRKHEGADEEEEAGETVVRRGWGSTTRTYPGSAGNGEVEDIGALLGAAAKVEKQEETVVKKEEDVDGNIEEASGSKPDLGDVTVKQEEPAASTAPVVFKKRKAKIAK